jgi:hypothetical protein
VTPLTFATLTFVCAFGGALAGSLIRAQIPATHLSKESQDVMRLGMGLVATMTALLLGLVTASARSSFDSTDGMVRQMAANLISLDRLLARYGPETAEARQLLRTIIEERVTNFEQGNTAAAVTRTRGVPPAEAIENEIINLAATTEPQRWYKSEAMKLCEDVLRTRWRVFGTQGSVSMIFLIVVVSWLTVTFASFGLYAQFNASVTAVLFVAALSVAAAVFLILELDGPFDGLIRISMGPLRFALEQLGQ